MQNTPKKSPLTQRCFGRRGQAQSAIAQIGATMGGRTWICRKREEGRIPKKAPLLKKSDS